MLFRSQCAGFLRIRDGEIVLDNTAVHPESYGAAQKLLDKFGYTEDDVRGGKLKDLPKKIAGAGEESVAAEIGVGVPTLTDIVSELLKPGRDVRDQLPPPVLRSDLMDMNDLKEGMRVLGVVRNVTDFGAFVDISVHQDGLLHISEISDNFVRHPSDVLKVGDKLEVWVLSVDKEKHRIALTMLDPATRDQRKAEYEKQKQERADKKAEWEKIKAERAAKKAEWEKRHAEYEQRKAERAARGENGDRHDRHDRHDGHGHKFDRRDGNGEGEQRRFERRDDRRERGDYRDRDRENVIDTSNMSMEEKLAALVGKFNKK